MLRILRLGLIALSTTAFYVAWHINPEILSPHNLYVLLGVWVATWGIALYFYRKISELSNLKELSSNAYRRIALILPEIRFRIWTATILCGLSSLAFGVLAALDIARESAFLASVTGLLIGFAFAYFIVFPFWLDEVQSFVEKVRLQDTIAQRREGTLKSFQSSSTKS